ncbi:hypothetical protein IE077_001683 [Cardiosporidium cionae]|uniref:Uncharacterized protein n=1 Tax=Cardiosporidium cionae TaxID=476202 RepID=A0ABQ7JCP1_9APIC|nr:hypothetical protein IE077_001683 [Cardiosporidium cionae]|eukprot:KAF8821718.1 hypothetical protein IE077_001683 [Cardiosporidium cionae]
MRDAKGCCLDEKCITPNKYHGIILSVTRNESEIKALPVELTEACRPVALISSDCMKIMEALLISEAIPNYKNIARKLSGFFETLMKAALFDEFPGFGLSCVCTVISRTALLRKMDKEKPLQDTLLQVTSSIILPMLRENDIQTFIDVLQGYFPGSNCLEVVYDKDRYHLTEAFVQLGQQVTEIALLKAFQLLEARRHYPIVLIAGKAMSGKTSIINAAKTAIELSFSNELQRKSFGELWVILDGFVDSDSIAKLRCVIDGQEEYSTNCKTAELSNITPSLISRVGIIYVDTHIVGLMQYINSWLISKDDGSDEQKQLLNILKTFFQKLAQVFEQYLDEVESSSRQQHILKKLIRLFDALLLDYDKNNKKRNVKIIQKMLTLALIWASECPLDDEMQPKFEDMIRSIDDTIPSAGSVLDYVVDFELGTWKTWVELSRLPSRLYDTAMTNLVVPSAHSSRVCHLTKLLILNGEHVLCIGNHGIGKSYCIMNGVLKDLDQNNYQLSLIALSHLTTSSNIKRAIIEKMEKKMHFTYYPRTAEKLICFLDDLNASEKTDEKRTSHCEIIRKYLEHGNWYDRQAKTFAYCNKNCILYGAVQPSECKASMRGACFGHCQDVSLVEKELFPDNYSTSLLFRTASSFQAVLYFLSVNNKNMYNECLRTFHDQMISRTDQAAFVDLIDDLLQKNLQIGLDHLCGGDHKNKIFTRFPIENSGELQSPGDQLWDIPTVENFLHQKLLLLSEKAGETIVDCAFFSDAVQHCSRVFRALCSPNENMILVGTRNSGRRTVVKLAAFCADVHSCDISNNFDCNKEHSLSTFLQLFSSQESLATPQVFTIAWNDSNDISFKRFLSGLLENWDTSILCEEERDTIRQLYEKNSSVAGAMDCTDEECCLFATLKQNAHIILLINPGTTGFTKFCRYGLRQECAAPYSNIISLKPAFYSIRLNPSIIKCTDIDWYHSWDCEAHNAIAAVDLDTLSCDNSSIATFFHAVAESIKREESAERQMTRQHSLNSEFIDVLKIFIHLYEERSQHLAEQKCSIRQPLNKILKARTYLEEMKCAFDEKCIQIQQNQKLCQELLIAIMELQMNLEEQSNKLSSAQQALVEHENYLNKLKNDSRESLTGCVADLTEASQYLEKMDKKQFIEMRSTGKPPELILKVLYAAMVLLNKPPTWQIAKIELNDGTFVSKLKSIDPHTISNEIMRKVQHYMTDSEYALVNIRKMSHAAYGLMKWVLAIKYYWEAFILLEPLQNKIRTAELTVVQNHASVAQIEQSWRDTTIKLEETQKRHHSAVCEKVKLNSLTEELNVKICNYMTYLDSFESIYANWTEKLEQNEKKLHTLTGTCCLAAAALSYLPPLHQERRIALMENWKCLLKDVGLMIDDDFSLPAFLYGKEALLSWQMKDWCQCSNVRENLACAEFTRKWVCFVDPLDQGKKWLSYMGGNENAIYLQASSDEIDSEFEIAMQSDESTHINIDLGYSPSHAYLFLSKFSKQKEENRNKKDMKSSSDGATKSSRRVFFYTSLPIELIIDWDFPNISVIYFPHTHDRICNAFVEIILQELLPDFIVRYNRFLQQIFEEQKALAALEKSISKALSTADLFSPDDEQQLNNIHQELTMVSEKTKKITLLGQQIQKLEEHAKVYRDVGEHASRLFLILNRLPFLSPHYQFAYELYVDRFKLNLRKYCSNEVLTRSDDEVVQQLKQSYSLSIHKLIWHNLHDQHRFLFSFYFAISHLLYEGKLKQSELDFFLTDRKIDTKTNFKKKRNPAPDWISALTWENILYFEKVSNVDGFHMDFIRSINEWKKWCYRRNEPEILLPGGFEQQLSDFQKLNLVRLLRPNLLFSRARYFVASTMGSKYVEYPSLDVHAVITECSCRSPLLLLSSGFTNPYSDVLKASSTSKIAINFCWKGSIIEFGMRSCAILKILSLVSTTPEEVIREIKSCTKAGQWLFLDNCSSNLEKLTDLIQPINRELDLSPHQQFRLFLSALHAVNIPIGLLKRCQRVILDTKKNITNMHDPTKIEEHLEDTETRNSSTKAVAHPESFSCNTDEPSELSKLFLAASVQFQ